MARASKQAGAAKLWDGDDERIRQGGSLGLRLRLADLAAGLRLRGERAGAASRLSPLALRVLACPPRHAGAARAGPRARSWWCLPGARLPGHGRAGAGDRVLS